MSDKIIAIEWLQDDYDCETCGFSCAEGARVLIDGEVAFTMEPSAYCFDGTSYSEWQVYHRLLHHLGYDVPEPAWASPLGEELAS